MQLWYFKSYFFLRKRPIFPKQKGSWANLYGDPDSESLQGAHLNRLVGRKASDTKELFLASNQLTTFLYVLLSGPSKQLILA